jgi:hypothetical protein
MCSLHEEYEKLLQIDVFVCKTYESKQIAEEMMVDDNLGNFTRD